MTFFILPEKKFIEPNRELVLPGTRLAGFYKFEATNRFTGKKRLLKDWFPNLITNNGLNGIGATSNVMNLCKVGSGNTAPTFADSQMQSFIASSNSVQTDEQLAQSTPPYYGYSRRVYRFNAGVAAGNIAEVGVGTTSGNTGVLFSRALINDGGSPTTPTTITVLSDEFLDVTYELRNYPVTTSDYAGSIVISGETYNYTARVANITSSQWAPGTNGMGGPSTASVYDGVLGAITSTPNGNNSNGSELASSYSTDTFYRESTFTWGLTQGNLAGSPSGIRCLAFRHNGNSFGWSQFQFDHSIPKTSSRILAIVARHTWARL